ncbi:hypothetical protein [Solicola sp. PLA-1-18]|uniref:hypothetical protein n=1 Tax=Solicola sp. PLA-1-18 TaxID=3380532 RepID=UPI003B7E0B19
MPYARQTKRSDNAGTSKIVDPEQLKNLFRFPTLYALGDLVTEALTRHGRGRKPYPYTALLIIVVAARVTASLPEALKMLRDPALWEECSDRYASYTGGQRLPMNPPTRAQVTFFRDQITTHPTLLADLQTEFQRNSIRQAQHLGNLKTDVAPDWSEPHEQNLVYGDGTILAPYSDVYTVTHPRTGESIVMGSRAKSPASARIQTVLSRTEEDDKRTRGINFVAMHTWTRKGRVVLGTASALHAESWAALDLLDTLAATAAGGIHTLVYDRAITGWHVDYLMAKHRVQVIGKAVGRARDGQDDEREQSHSPDRVARLAAEYEAEPSPDVNQMLRHDLLLARHFSNKPLPLGTSQYLTSKEKIDFVRSRTHHLPAFVHDGPAGTCEHRLAVDDGSLYEIGPDEDYDFDLKLQHLPCTRSTPTRRPDGRWGTRNTFSLRCGDRTHEVVREWEPDGTRYYRGDKDREKIDRIGCDLRPLSRAIGEQFAKVFGRRNDSESYNKWMQNTTQHAGRAATSTLEGQELDFLSAAVLNNSNTWHRP